MLKSNHSTALADELAAARQKYINKRNSILDRVQQRRGAIGETVRDLNAEDAALAKVQAEAQNDTQ